MVGLMRYQAYSMLGPAGSKTRHGSSRLTSVPAIAVLCVLAGYILGRSHVPDREPYPLDMVGDTAAEDYTCPLPSCSRKGLLWQYTSSIYYCCSTLSAGL